MSEEIKTNNGQENAATQPEDNGVSGKLFTQDDVDRIIKDRLKRSRESQGRAVTEEQAAQAEALTKREADVTSRENRLACREYLLESGYPRELLDVIDTGDVEAFKQKADKAAGVFATQTRSAAPLATLEVRDGYRGNSRLDEAFSREKKHTPGGFYAGYEKGYWEDQ